METGYIPDYSFTNNLSRVAANRIFSESELVENLKSGGQLNETVRFMYQQYFQLISGYILQNSGSHQDAEDMFQEVLVNFIDLVRREKFRRESTVRTFLYSMTRHTWLNELKRRNRTLARENKYRSEPGIEEVEIGELLEEADLKKQLLDIVAGLGETCRKILVLFYYENLPVKAIVDKTGYQNEQVVRNKKYKCLRQLEQKINADPGKREKFKNLLHE